MDLTSFRRWLISRNYSPSTVRNYLADINRYLEFTNHHSPVTDIKNLFSSEVISPYFNHISGTNNQSRRLASLNKFCQYALDQHLISHNPLKKLQRQPRNTTDDLLQQYQKHLERHKVSPVTIKNYIGDIKQFLAWTSN